MIRLIDLIWRTSLLRYNICVTLSYKLEFLMLCFIARKIILLSGYFIYEQFLPCFQKC